MFADRRLAIALVGALMALSTSSAAIAASKGGGGGAITPDPALRCGDTITRSTLFTRDIDCSGTSTGDASFYVNTPGITIDLGGFSMTGYGEMYVFKVRASNVTIRNGTLRITNGGEGVDIGYPGTVLSKLTIRAPHDGSYGIVCQPLGDPPGGIAGVSVSGVTIVGGGEAINAIDCQLSVSSTTITDVLYYGINAMRSNATVPVRAAISGVTVYGVGGTEQYYAAVQGLRIPMTISNSYLHHSANGVLFLGFGAGPLTLQGSRVEYNAYDGASVTSAYSDGSAASISSNVFLSNGVSGLYLQDSTAGTVVKGNTSNQNNYGFYADTSTVASSGNTARLNVSFGFFGGPSIATSSTDRCYGNNPGGPQSLGAWTCTETSK